MSASAVLFGANEARLMPLIRIVLPVKFPIPGAFKPVADEGSPVPPGTGENTGAPGPTSGAGDMAAEAESPTCEDIRDRLDLWSPCNVWRAAVSPAGWSTAVLVGTKIF